MGVVVAFEGLEGAGKTTAVATCEQILRDMSVSVGVVGEFSESPLGEYLFQRLSQDRFLRDPRRARTAWTQVFAVAADTAFALEYTIPDLRDRHQVVLKDRYRESVVACQHVAVADEYGISDREAHDILAGVTRPLPDIADLVVWLDVPAPVRHERLRRRHDFFPGDAEILRRRELSYRRLLGGEDPPPNYRVVDGTGDVLDVGRRIVDLILSAYSDISTG